MWFWGRRRDTVTLGLGHDVADALRRALERRGSKVRHCCYGPPLMTARDYVRALATLAKRDQGAPRAAWRNWLADLIKELAKNAVRHPNRRVAEFA